MSEDISNINTFQQPSVEEVPAPNNNLVLQHDHVINYLQNSLASLSLSLRVARDWIVLTRHDFDLVTNGLPYQLISFLLQPHSGKWMSRFGARTLASGVAVGVEELPVLVSQAFERVVPCEGVPPHMSDGVSAKLRRQMVDTSAETPFRPLASVKCSYVVKLEEGEGICDLVPNSCLQCIELQNKINQTSSMVASFQQEGNDGMADYIVPPDPTTELCSSFKNVKEEPIEELEAGTSNMDAGPLSPFVDDDEDDDENDQDKDWKVEMKGELEELDGEEEEEEDLDEILDNLDEEDFNGGKKLKGKMSTSPQKAKKPRKKPEEGVEGSVKCSEPGCTYTCASKPGLTYHNRKVHLIGRFFCYYCSKVFKAAQELIDHVSADHPEQEKIVCGLCSKHLSKAEYPVHHVACLEAGRNKEERKRIHDILMKCVLCGEQNKNRLKLQIHLSNHAGMVYKCKEENCDYETKLFFGLQNHERKHRRERGEENNCFVCHLCAKSYTTAFYLNEHIQYFHEKKPDNIRCEHCGMNFERKKNYQKHCNMVHSNDPKYQCKVCGKRFRLESDVKKHEFRHTGLPVGYCDLCGKGLKSKNSLKAHMLAHRGEKPYKCKEQFCEYSCVSSTALSLHRRFKHRGGELAEVSKANGRFC